MRSRIRLVRFLQNRLLTDIAVASFIVAFHLSYRYLIVPNYNYQGFVYEPREPTIWVAFLLAFLPSKVLPVHLRRPSSFVLWLLYLLVYVPAQLVLAYTFSGFSEHLFYFQLSLLASMTIVSLVPRLPTIPLPRFSVPPWLFWLGVLGYVAFVYGLLFKVFGFKGFVGSLSEVYQVRLEAREVLADAGRWVGYSMRWLSEAVNPFLMAVGISERRWGLFVLGVLGQVLIFSFDATKSTLGSIVFVIGLFYLISRSFTLYARHLVLAFLGLFAFVAALDSLIRQPVFTGLLLRRLFAVPGLLTSFYLDYFSTHPHFYWTHTVYARLLGFTNTVYPQYASPGFLIGDIYFHNPAGNANVNLWADGYANAGLWGVALITLLLYLLLWFYDSVSARKDLRVALLLIAMPAFALTNTSLLTSLLSHGWLPAILLMWYYPSLRRNNRGRR